MNKYKYTIVVMDYESATVHTYYLAYEPEDPEQWLYDHTDYNDSSCYYMCAKDITFESDVYED